MAKSTVFKTFLNSDVTNTKTLLHEAIPIPGSLVSGTYGIGDFPGGGATEHDKPLGAEPNIKQYTHGMFVSVYDYPHASSSANHIFDITVGVSRYVPQGSTNNNWYGVYDNADQLYEAMRDSTDSATNDYKKKNSIYAQMAKVLAGEDTKGNIRHFDRDGNYGTLDDKIIDPIFLNFSRLLTKDEIKKGSFKMEIGCATSYANPFGPNENTQHVLTIADTNAQNNYRVNSPAGEFGILTATSVESIIETDRSAETAAANNDGDPDTVGLENPPAMGLIFYQAGIVVLDGSRIFMPAGEPDNAGNAAADDDGMRDLDGILQSSFTPKFIKALNADPGEVDNGNNSYKYSELLINGSINLMAHNIRHRIKSITFNNTTELNSTVYFCRAHHNEFNYSSNPTYLDGSQIRVKNNAIDPPRSYITTVGLYSSDNELLAVAKLSEPIRKDPTNEVTLRVRLDY